MPNVYRVYHDEERMLKVYNRRLALADNRFGKREPELRGFIHRYQNKPDEDDFDVRGERINVTAGIGLIDTMFSSMTAVDVEYICKAMGQGTPIQAIAATNALNQAWRDSKGQRKAKRAVKDALLTDVGWVKVYYDYQEDIAVRDRTDLAVKAEMQELLGQDNSLTAEDLARMVPTTEEYPVIVRDRVCVDYVPWDMIRYDTSAKQPEDLRWVAQYTRMPVPEVTLNPTYQAFVEDRYGVEAGRKLLDELQGDTTILTGLEGTYEEDLMGFGDEDEDDVRVTVVEMWDFETGLVTIFPKGNQELVLHQRQNPLMVNVDMTERNPFKPLFVRDDPDEFEGLGDMRVITPALEELDGYRSNLSTYMKRTIPKLIGPARAITEQGKKALESQTWGEYVGLEEGHVRSEVGTLDIPALPQEVFSVPEKILQEMQDGTGAGEVLRGVFPEKRTTATETSLVADSGQRRQAERRSALEEWYTDIAHTMLQLMQIYYDQKKVMRFSDDLGNEFAWTWDRESIALEADIDVAITPKEALTRQERFNRALQAMNLGLPLPETDRTELLRMVYREMGLSESEIRALVKTPEEVQAEQQQQQIQAQIAAAPQPTGQGPAGLRIG